MVLGKASSSHRYGSSMDAWSPPCASVFDWVKPGVGAAVVGRVLSSSKIFAIPIDEFRVIGQIIGELMCNGRRSNVRDSERAMDGTLHVTQQVLLVLQREDSPSRRLVNE